MGSLETITDLSFEMMNTIITIWLDLYTNLVSVTNLRIYILTVM